MARGAAALGVGFDRAAVERALGGVGGGGPLRVRLTLALDGTQAVAAAPLGPAPAGLGVVLAAARLRLGRPMAAAEDQRAGDLRRGAGGAAAGVDEAVLLNERGEVCDGTITNVFLDRGAGLVTPPLGLRAAAGGAARGAAGAGRCREAVLGPADLGRGRLWVGNSLRGLMPARLV